jgi:hypothetical protein
MSSETTLKSVRVDEETLVGLDSDNFTNALMPRGHTPSTVNNDICCDVVVTTTGEVAATGVIATFGIEVSAVTRLIAASSDELNDIVDLTVDLSATEKTSLVIVAVDNMVSVPITLVGVCTVELERSFLIEAAVDASIV